MFIHKDIQKYTREVHSRKEKSIIDYFKNMKKKKHAEIESDHYLVVMETLTNENILIKGKRRKVEKEKLRLIS